MKVRVARRHENGMAGKRKRCKNLKTSGGTWIDKFSRERTSYEQLRQNFVERRDRWSEF
ncbi:hypothetical protein BY996DRAFT_6578483 [Phakopsora pachyrhizi]|uniref:Uncharacterized protein n=1 Tax=Phakopsora pachyrhizi TaxID=170000 RepID=A0AAV0B529_PHAPC|nr:hypothetical protein BY996DRAFT_6578483 [Phakopsora pachyrhizi]CAH7682086.1 hypothetical protein PPACK8108_LOCUS14793 [Phakopsora pachyrhizi]